MVDSADRKIMAELNGIAFANHRDASTSGGLPVWKRQPTVIEKPSNSKPSANGLFTDDKTGVQPNRLRTSEQQSTRPSGSNPYSQRGVGASRNKQKGIGNRTSAQTLVNLEPSNKKAKREPRDHTFNMAPNNRSHSKSVSNNKNMMHSNPQRPVVVSEQEIIHVEDDDDSSIPEPVAGIKRPFSQSSDELNIGPHESVSLPHQPSKYSFSENNYKRTEERGSGLAPDGKNTRWVGKFYGGIDDSDPIENCDSDREAQPPETRESEEVIQEAQHPESGGRVRRLVNQYENNDSIKDNGPKVDLNQVNKKAKNMKPKNQPKAQLKINRPQPTNVDPEPSKHDIKIQDSIATSTTLQRKKAGQYGPIPLKRVCIEHFEYSEERPQAFFSRQDALFIRDGDEELFNLSSWPMESLHMEYTIAIDPPTIQIRSRSDDSGKRILTIQFEKGTKYEPLLTRLHGAISTKGAVRNDTQLWRLAEMHRDQTAVDQSNDVKGKEPQFKKQKLSVSDAQSKSLRYTPSQRHTSRTSDLRDEGSEGQASRSTSKSRSYPPPLPRAGGVVAPRRSTRNAPPEKPVDQDKVILVYPQGVPGAVNITNGDLARLQPGEYLNDTLIEFGLKLWLRKLEEKQPELAQKVHIFNSFFYKKLNNKKNEVQAFETVRKWTSKFDIFQKKYIIVPINEHMHWYLAIIYEPEHVLTSTAPDETPTRKRTRLSAKVDPEETISTSAPEPVDVGSSARSITSSEMEVEHNLNTEFQSSCNIDIVVDDDMGAEKMEVKKEDDASSDALSYATNPDDFTSHPQPPKDQTFLDNSKEAALDSMDVDEVVEIESGSKDDSTITEVPAASTSTSKSVSRLSPIPPTSFYAKSAKSKGKQKAKAQADPIDIDGEAQNKTYIFTFDSLGTNHPHAAKKLAQYLRMEAKDKKGIPNAGVATGKTAHVPVQPNFCDCGVYLIHFAQTFLTDPKKYFDIIMSQPKLTNNQEKQEQWNDKQVADMREELSTQIQDLSTVWIKDRALKEEEARAQQGSKDPDHINVDNSDDDIEMPSPVKKSGRTTGRAARIRG